MPIASAILQRAAGELLRRIDAADDPNSDDIASMACAVADEYGLPLEPLMRAAAQAA